jgi:YVTN family beta-propeller protein
MRPLKTITLDTGMRPMGTVTGPDGKHVYVSTGRSKMVLAVNTSTDTVVGSVEAGVRPWGIAISRDGATLYTANGPSNDVSIIDVASMQVRQRVGVGTGPWGITVVSRAAGASR